MDAEWDILYDKLQKIQASGAKVVLSKLPIGDVATQWFADRYVLPDNFAYNPFCFSALFSVSNFSLLIWLLLTSRDMFCTGRVADDDLQRTLRACGLSSFVMAHTQVVRCRHPSTA